MADLDPQEIHVAAAALRRFINITGYGAYVPAAIVEQGAAAAVQAVEQYRAGADEHIKEAEKARDAQAAEQKAEAYKKAEDDRLAAEKVAADRASIPSYDPVTHSDD